MRRFLGVGASAEFRLLPLGRERAVTRTRPPGATGYQEGECRNGTHPEPPSAAGQVSDNKPFLSVYLSGFSLPDLTAPAPPMNTFLDRVVSGSDVTPYDFALNCAMTVFEVPA